MRNVMDLYNECLSDIIDCGIKVGRVVSVTINTRAKRRWGQCVKLSNGTYTINISSRLLNEDVDIWAAKNTMAHEILHTVDGCMNHGPEWKRVANIVNSKYPNYNIKRTTSSEEKGISKSESYKFSLTCKDCGKKYYYMKKCKAVQNYRIYTCGCCHGSLILNELGSRI